MNYYGLDWASRFVIGWAIWLLPRRPRMAYCVFAVANVASIATALVASPPLWGLVVGDSVFFFMHLYNIRKGSHA